ncbi:MAG: hypothetical protein ACM3IJ_04025 [Candidatus Levyibacteriota bacterium]
MRTIVTHNSPDLDAIASSWIIKRFLPGWQDAEVITVPAGGRLNTRRAEGDVIEHLDDKEIIHVDTGMGPLDHHQTHDDNTCATERAFAYVLKHSEELKDNKHKADAIRRLVEYVIDDDHFQEVFFPDAAADIYEFSMVGLIAGIKVQYPRDDQTCLRFGFDLLEAAVHGMEERLWAEEEIKEKGIQFNTRWGKGIAMETLNDETLKLAQILGYVIAVRKDPKSGAVRIKARPAKRRVPSDNKNEEITVDTHGTRDTLDTPQIDLTPVYEKLLKMDPEATWFLHVSKRMLLNGSTKNPGMRGSKLTLSEVVEVLQNLQI